LLNASYGVAGFRLGKPGTFDLKKAAVVDFANAAAHPLSPLSMTTGVPNVTDAAETGFEIGKQIAGNTLSGPAAAAENLVNQYGVLLNKMGPYQAFTVIQTETLTERSWFFGLIRRTPEWVADAPVYTPVNNGPLAGGFYISPGPAAEDAYKAVMLQLQSY
jgi:hypothetical protein